MNQSRNTQRYQKANNQRYQKPSNNQQIYQKQSNNQQRYQKPQKSGFKRPQNQYRQSKNIPETFSNFCKKKCVSLSNDVKQILYQQITHQYQFEHKQTYSLNNIQKLTTPGIEKYITDKKLYEHCKSKYVDKIISKKSKSKKSKSKKSKTKKSKHRTSKTKKNKKK